MASHCRSSECMPTSLWLTHAQPSLFYSPQWTCRRSSAGSSSSSSGRWRYVLYLVHRIFWALYLLVWLVLSGALPSYWYSSEKNKAKWFVYLTNWAFLALTASALVRAVVATYAFAFYIQNGIHVERMTWWLKSSWALYSLSTAFAIVISVLFWSVIFSGAIDIVDVNTHGVNSGYVLVDLAVTATPVRVLHFWMPLAYGVTYLLFTVAYELLGGTSALDQTYIYKVLDWNSAPSTAGTYAVAALVAIGVAHCLLFGLTKLRILVATSCCSASSGALAGSRELLAVPAKNGEIDSGGSSRMNAVRPLGNELPTSFP